jgi:hypothetical protein
MYPRIRNWKCETAGSRLLKIGMDGAHYGSEI